MRSANEGAQQRMTYVLSTSAGGTNPWRRRTGLAASCLAVLLTALWSLLPAKPAVAADPAVVFMAQVGRELMAAARTRSPGVMAVSYTHLTLPTKRIV